MRLQVYTQNAYNVKRANQDVLKRICSIKKTRKHKTSDYLQDYLQMIFGYLSEMAGGAEADFRQKEAVMHALGLLATHMARSKDLQAGAMVTLEQFVSPELTREDNAMLRARAAWVYGEFSSFPYNSEAHNVNVLQALYANLQCPELPLRVNAAIALVNHLD